MLATGQQGLPWPTGTPFFISPTDRNKLVAQLRIEGPCGMVRQQSSQRVSVVAGQISH